MHCTGALKTRVKAILAAAVMSVALLAFSGGCSGEEPAAVASETRVLLDTYCTITIYGAHDASLLEEAFEMCAGYEALFSITREGSDVWRINHAGGEPVTVAPQTAGVICEGLSYCELSGGLFDITIGRVSRLWDFSGNPRVPADAELEAARATVDYRKVLVEGNSVTLLNPEAWIDLGGIAKGYIANRLAEFLLAREVAGAVIDLGGDVAIIGEKPDGEPWRLGVRQPFGGRSDLLGVIETGEASVVTSGVYERQFESGGRLYHHILDPVTGFPVVTDIVSATVVTDNSTAGDALSTIAVLAGSAGAADLLSRADGFTGAVLLLDSGELLTIGDVSFR